MRALTALATALVVFPAMAFAHPGGPSELGFVNGLIHPLTGVDHVAAALLVGGLAAFSRSAGWVTGAFLGAIVAGVFVGSASVSATAAEMGIFVGFATLATVFVLRNAAAWLVPIASAATGLAHGAVHGGVGGGSDAFATGVVATTTILVGASYLVARLPMRSRSHSRVSR